MKQMMKLCWVWLTLCAINAQIVKTNVQSLRDAAVVTARRTVQGAGVEATKKATDHWVVFVTLGVYDAFGKLKKPGSGYPFSNDVGTFLKNEVFIRGSASAIKNPGDVFFDEANSSDDWLGYVGLAEYVNLQDQWILASGTRSFDWSNGASAIDDGDLFSEPSNPDLRGYSRMYYIQKFFQWYLEKEKLVDTFSGVTYVVYSPNYYRTRSYQSLGSRDAVIVNPDSLFVRMLVDSTIWARNPVAPFAIRCIDPATGRQIPLGGNFQLYDEDPTEGTDMSSNWPARVQTVISPLHSYFQGWGSQNLQVANTDGVYPFFSRGAGRLVWDTNQKSGVFFKPKGSPDNFGYFFEHFGSDPYHSNMPSVEKNGAMTRVMLPNNALGFISARMDMNVTDAFNLPDGALILNNPWNEPVGIVEVTTVALNPGGASIRIRGLATDTDPKKPSLVVDGSVTTARKSICNSNPEKVKITAVNNDPATRAPGQFEIRGKYPSEWKQSDVVETFTMNPLQQKEFTLDITHPTHKDSGQDIDPKAYNILWTLTRTESSIPAAVKTTEALTVYNIVNTDILRAVTTNGSFTSQAIKPLAGNEIVTAWLYPAKDHYGSDKAKAIPLPKELLATKVIVEELATGNLFECGIFAVNVASELQMQVDLTLPAELKGADIANASVYRMYLEYQSSNQKSRTCSLNVAQNSPDLWTSDINANPTMVQNAQTFKPCSQNAPCEVGSYFTTYFSGDGDHSKKLKAWIVLDWNNPSEWYEVLPTEFTYQGRSNYVGLDQYNGRMPIALQSRIPAGSGGKVWLFVENPHMGWGPGNPPPIRQNGIRENSYTLWVARSLVDPQ